MCQTLVTRKYSASTMVLKWVNKYKRNICFVHKTSGITTVNSFENLYVLLPNPKNKIDESKILFLFSSNFFSYLFFRSLVFSFFFLLFSFSVFSSPFSFISDSVFLKKAISFLLFLAPPKNVNKLTNISGR